MPYRDELEAALARAEAAERKLAERCTLHPDRDAGGACSACGRGVCPACLMTVGDGTPVCPACYARAGRRSPGWARPAIFFMSAILATCIVAACLATLAHPQIRSRRDGQIAALRARLVAKPCDESTAGLMGGMLEPREVLTFVADYEASCPASRDLLWRKAGAQEQLGQWNDAARTSATLIATDPENFNAWAFHGRELAMTGQSEAAAADLRQALAIEPTTETFRSYEKLVRGLGRTCEARFAWRSMSKKLVDQESTPIDPGPFPPAVPMPEASCEGLEGVGEGQVREVTTVEIDGAVGRFTAGYDSAFVVVTRKFAERAGIVPKAAPVVKVYDGDTVRSATLGVARVVSVGKARAHTIDVAVVDELPDGVDGVLGTTFLYRFGVSVGHLSPWD